jgi:hypothetical protein
MFSNKSFLALSIVAASLALATVGRADNISYVHTSADTTGNFFVADVAATDTSIMDGERVRDTGIIDHTRVVTAPLPGAFALFGSVLVGGLGLSTWRRSRSRRSTTSVLS